MKSRHARIDPEFRSFLLEYAECGVFPERSKEARIIRAVAYRGLAVLGFRDREIWYEKILPVLGKPMSEQIAVGAILRNGGRVPPRIGELADDDLHPFPLAHDLSSLQAKAESDEAEIDLLSRITRELRSKSRGADRD